MQTPKLDVFVAFLTFGGNGSVSTIIPSHSDWLAETAVKAANDPRVGRFEWARFGDIPLDIERNKIVEHAKKGGFDVVIMLDSDNFIDKYVGHDPSAKPFWDSSFDFLYQRTLKGLPTVVCCPYCGPPPDDVRGGMENVYVFQFTDLETLQPGQPQGQVKLTAYSREHATMMKGIGSIGAGPTGVIMYSMSAFDLFPPCVPKEEILEGYAKGQYTIERAKELLDRQGWFFYEANANRTEKQSTEDVTNTREIQMAGLMQYGQPVLFCNWDAWAGHWKPKCVGKPLVLPIEAVGSMFRDAVRNNVSVHERIVEVDYTKPGDFKYEGPIIGFREDEKPPGSAEYPPFRETVDRNGHPFTHIGFVSNQKSIETLQELVMRYRPESVVEVGSWVGDSAIAMMEADEALNVTCVDTFKGTDTDQCGDIARGLSKITGKDIVYETFLENIEPYQDRVLVVRRDSLTASDRFHADTFDMAYLDAGHTYKEVKDDIEAWLPLVEKHGIIAGHDYDDPQFPGVKEAVDEFFGANIVNSENHVWWVRVKDHIEKKSPVEPKTAQMVLGRKFEQTIFDKESIEVIYSALGRNDYAHKQVVVIGDPHGELTWAAAKDSPMNTVYRMVGGKEIDYFILSVESSKPPQKHALVRHVELEILATAKGGASECVVVGFTDGVENPWSYFNLLAPGREGFAVFEKSESASDLPPTDGEFDIEVVSDCVWSVTRKAKE